ncbi:Methyltransferase domain-containing protein [Fontibacillus panacisegetis]|uniref:Methyltransferase domain-containing protein n=1 Tax=Fontibacillus panacisegetis TaxID=670482 RepID=A0A1G7SZL1_9BACL|nr:methyltransferase domain-containing protein [Fontibacillus panacisegetis]SDG28485.1 Methyltransferase domain-containing protein [Fontibacillus panacisegetis]
MGIDAINDYLNIQNSITDSDKYAKFLNDKRDIIIAESSFRSFDNVIDIGCGDGYITKKIRGNHILGIDISDAVIQKADENCTRNVEFSKHSLFDLIDEKNSKYDLVLFSEVLYEPYIGGSCNLIYKIIDNILNENGVVITCHVDDYYRMRFPYLLKNQLYFDNENDIYKLEVYIK